MERCSNCFMWQLYVDDKTVGFCPVHGKTSFSFYCSEWVEKVVIPPEYFDDIDNVDGC